MKCKDSPRHHHNNNSGLDEEDLLLGRVGRSLLRRYQTCNEAQGRLFEHVLYKHAFSNKMICVQLFVFNSDSYGRTSSHVHNS